MSANPPTRPGLSEEQFQQLLRAIQERGGGANITVTDPRLTKLMIWVLTTVGGLVILGAGWLVGDSIDKGRLLERVVTIQERQSQDMAETKQRVTRLEERKL